MTKAVLIGLFFALSSLAAETAYAGKTIDEAGALVCITDKWDEKEIAPKHKTVDFAGRCVGVPDDPAAEKYTEDCTAKYEYMPDESWKGVGGCTWHFKNGDTVTDTFEEGSHLKESTYTTTGGTGRFQGAKGGGTYTNENLTETLSGGRFKGKMELP